LAVLTSAASTAKLTCTGDLTREQSLRKKMGLDALHQEHNATYIRVARHSLKHLSRDFFPYATLYLKPHQYFRSDSLSFFVLIVFPLARTPTVPGRS
jgi:hypothetical protein